MRLLLLLVFGLSGLGLCAQAPQEFTAQDLSRITWRVTVTPATGLAVGSEAVLRIEATLPGKWHVYSVEEGEQYVFKPTRLRLAPGAEGLELLGSLQPEGTTKNEFDDILEGKVVYFEHTAAFTQRVRITKANPNLKLIFSYQACEFDQLNTCIFPEVEMPLRLRTGR